MIPISFILLLLLLCVSVYKSSSVGAKRPSLSRRRPDSRGYQDDLHQPDNEPSGNLSDKYYESDNPQPYYQTEKSDYSNTADDVVYYYTKSSTSKAIVAVSAGLSSAFLAIFTFKMVISWVPPSPIIGIIGLLGLLQTYLKGDLGDFCRSIGVFTILIVTRARIGSFLLGFIRQLRGLTMLSVRSPFPPGDNPWNYVPEVNEPDIGFSMTYSLLGVVLSSAYIGWALAKKIPFFPGWIGALSLSGVLGYAGTFNDTRGDTIRFIGHSLTALFTHLSLAMDDVKLKEKIRVLFGKILHFIRILDQRYDIIGKLQVFWQKLIQQITTAMKRSDMNDNSVKARATSRSNNDWEANDIDNNGQFDD
eukprot:gene10526-14142_t